MSKRTTDPEQLAAVIWAANNYEPNATCDALVAAAYADPASFRKIVEPKVREAVYALLKNVARRQGRSLWPQQPQPTAEEQRRRIESLARGYERDFPAANPPDARPVRGGGNIAERDGSFFAWDSDDVFLGEFRTRCEALDAIAREQGR